MAECAAETDKPGDDRSELFAAVYHSDIYICMYITLSYICIDYLAVIGEANHKGPGPAFSLAAYDWAMTGHEK